MLCSKVDAHVSRHDAVHTSIDIDDWLGNFYADKFADEGALFNQAAAGDIAKVH